MDACGNLGNGKSVGVNGVYSYVFAVEGVTAGKVTVEQCLGKVCFVVRPVHYELHSSKEQPEEVDAGTKHPKLMGRSVPTRAVWNGEFCVDAVELANRILHNQHLNITWTYVCLSQNKLGGFEQMS